MKITFLIISIASLIFGGMELFEAVKYDQSINWHAWLFIGLGVGAPLFIVIPMAWDYDSSCQESSLEKQLNDELNCNSNLDSIFDDEPT